MAKVAGGHNFGIFSTTEPCTLEQKHLGPFPQQDGSQSLWVLSLHCSQQHKVVAKTRATEREASNREERDGGEQLRPPTRSGFHPVSLVVARKTKAVPALALKEKEKEKEKWWVQVCQKSK